MPKLSTELARLAEAASKSVPFASENLATALRENLPAIIAALKAAETPLGDYAGLVERLIYTHDHGIFDAQVAGMLTSPKEAADAITALTRQLAERDGEGEETGWLIEENAGGYIHWIALVKDQWPHTKVTRRRDRMHSDNDLEITRYLSPVMRVKDASAALRFSRKEDAEALMELFSKFLLHPAATEHIWSARAALKETQP